MIAERTPEPQKQPSPEETRERILSAAREVIARKGKRGATTREIAEVAGVNEATLFRHFGNKSALIVAVARHSCPDVAMRDFIATLSGPIEDELLEIGRKMTAHMEGMIDMIRWSLVESDYENSVFAQETWRPQTAIRDVIIDYMASRVASGVLVGNPEELATVFIGMIFARLVARQKFPETRMSVDTDYALRFFIDVFLNGVRSK